MIVNIIEESLRRVTGTDVINLDIPENPEFGDYTTNFAMQVFSEHKFKRQKSELKTKTIKLKNEEEKQFNNLTIEQSNNPRQLAEEIAEKLRSDKKFSEIVEKIEVAGPGFINFFLSKKYLTENLQEILKTGERYGTSEIEKGKKVMVEFAHPNTHKAFHIGHLRNITTGESLSRILAAAGNEVIRVNYQGDVGLHIAKALWGIRDLGLTDDGTAISRAEFLGKAYAHGSKNFEENEDAKKQVIELNKRIYNKDDFEINDLYQKTRQWSLDYFNSIYDRVYTKFDRLYFESEVFDRGLQLAKEALENGILERSDGAIVFPGEKYGLHTRVFVSSEGNPTYEAKDLGLAEIQLKEFSPDLIAHVVASEQAGYFQVLFKALELINPETIGREKHIVYGWVRLKEGKMSSRLGNVMLGENLIDEAKAKIQKAYKTQNETAEMIAVGAVKYSFLRTGTEQEIAFDLDESIALEGNSGPYLQYTYARVQSVLAKVRTQDSKLKTVTKNPKTNKSLKDISCGSEFLDLSYQLNEAESQILRVLVHFPEIVAEAGEKYSPNLICNYLYDLAQKFNSFYAKHKIIAEENIEHSAYNTQQTKDNLAIEQFRIALTAATSAVLKNGLKLLGIQAPERM